jgi:tetratricopeptide (TPR) repeat protein
MLRSLAALSLISLSAFASAPLRADERLSSADQRILDHLRQRLDSDPTHADSWRLVAKIYRRAKLEQEAIEALETALEAAPDLIAAHFDLGMLRHQRGETTMAIKHFRDVFRLGPETRYAQTLREMQLAPQATADHASPEATAVLPASYEIQTFDGSDRLARNLETLRQEFGDPPTPRWRWYVESGVMYNTNVSLTPISRELFDVDAASFQGFLNPEGEYDILQRGTTRSGPIGRAYLALNESHQSAFNLASFQAGWFAEHDRWYGNQVARIDYIYAADWLDGNRFGDRHAINLTTSRALNDTDLLSCYGSLSTSNFQDDGADPQIDSLDGPGFNAGISCYRRFPSSGLWESVACGLDLSGADTDGADYRYVGAGIHARVTCALSEQWRFDPSAGWAYRAYPDFTEAISRDENIIRVATRLRYLVSDRCELATVASYDRFASKNEDFDADRLEGGLVLILRR